MLAKVLEYFEAGVSVVCILDQVSETVQIHRDEELPQTLHNSDELYLPDVLGEIRVAVQRFFE